MRRRGRSGGSHRGTPGARLGGDAPMLPAASAPRARAAGLARAAQVGNNPRARSHEGRSCTPSCCWSGSARSARGSTPPSVTRCARGPASTPGCVPCSRAGWARAMTASGCSRRSGRTTTRPRPPSTPIGRRSRWTGRSTAPADGLVERLPVAVTLEPAEASRISILRVVSGITRAGQLDGYLDEARAGTLADRAIGEGPLALYLAVDPPDRFVTLSLWGGWSHVEAATGADHEHVDRTRHAERLATWTAEHYEVIPGLALVDPAPAEAGGRGGRRRGGRRRRRGGRRRRGRRHGHRPHRGGRLGQRRLPPPKIVSNTPRISDWPGARRDDASGGPDARSPPSSPAGAARPAARAGRLALALGSPAAPSAAHAPGARSPSLLRRRHRPEARVVVGETWSRIAASAAADAAAAEALASRAVMISWALSRSTVSPYWRTSGRRPRRPRRSPGPSAAPSGNPAARGGSPRAASGRPSATAR